MIRSMNTSVNPEHSITELKRIVESDKRSEIRLNANGGNSILLVCPPKLEFQYIEKLVEAGKQFEMQLYTNKNHSILGDKTRLHLYKRFNEFLKKNL